MIDFEAKLTQEERQRNLEIISRMRVEPKPSINEFLNVISNIIDEIDELKRGEVAKNA